MYLKNLTHHRLIQAMKGQGFWDKTTNNLKQEVLNSFNMEEMETEVEQLQLHTWREGIIAPPGSPMDQSHPFINDPVLTLDVPAQAKPQNVYHQLMLAQCHLSSCQTSFNQALGQLKAARKRVSEIKQKIRNIIQKECQGSLREVKRKSSRNWRADYRPPRTNKRPPKRLQKVHIHGFKSTKGGAPEGNQREKRPGSPPRRPPRSPPRARPEEKRQGKNESARQKHARLEEQEDEEEKELKQKIKEKKKAIALLKEEIENE